MRVKECERMGRPKGSRNVVRAKSDYKPEYAGMLLEFFRHYSEGEKAGGADTATVCSKYRDIRLRCATWIIPWQKPAARPISCGNTRLPPAVPTAATGKRPPGERRRGRERNRREV